MLKLKFMKADIKHKTKSGIYAIFNKINGKVYIGKSIDIHARIKSHITALNKKKLKQENQHFIGAWHKYNQSSFGYVVLEFCKIENLAQQELYFMKLFNSTDREFGYNIRMDSSSGMICSEETRAKMRKSHVGRMDKFPHLKETLSKSPEWMSDSHKVKIASKKVSDTRRKYDIAKIDLLTGSIIKVYLGMMEIKEHCPDYSRNTILSCCAGEKKSYKGFAWKYIDRKTKKFRVK